MKRMEKKTMKKRILSCAMVVLMMLTLFSGFTVNARAASEVSDFATNFANPLTEQSIKIRTWWPDAKATDDDIRAEVREIKAAGFGGIELIAIGTASDPANLGWGTDRWNAAMVALLDEAEKADILVDLTIGPRWPAAVRGLDPTTDEAQRKLIHSSLVLDIPAGNGKDFDLPDAPNASASAATANPEFVALVAAKYNAATTTASGTTITRNVTIDESTLEVIDPSKIDLTNKKFEFDKPLGGNYIIFAFWAIGVGQTAGSTSPSAYVVNHFNKAGANKVLAGWNDVFKNYPTIKNHFETYGGSFFVDSLEMTGADIYWSNDIEAYFKSNRGYDLMKNLPLIVRKGTSSETNALRATAAFTVGTVNIAAGGTYTLAENISSTINTNAGTEIRLDFIQTLSDLFNKYHIDTIQKWCEPHNMNLRMQAQGTGGSGWNDALASQLYVGVVEGESLGMSSHPDAFRSLAGSANMTGRNGLVSVELGADVGGAYRMTWQRLTETVNRCISAGANQFVQHGYPTLAQYTASEAWPSWSPFTTMFAEAWNHQNPSWAYLPVYTNYVSRLQTAMQYGNADVDLAVYRSNTGNTFYISGRARAGGASTRNAGNADPQMLYDYYTVDFNNVTGFVDDIGFTYNYISPESFNFPNAKVVGGVLNPDYSSYKALVIKDVETMELISAQAILGYAQAGLPIVLIGKTPDTGTASNVDKNYSTNNDDTVKQVFVALKKMSTVKAIADSSLLVDALADLGIKSDARYASQNIASAHRSSNDMDIYYLFNNSTTRDYEVSDFTHDNGASENVYHNPAKVITTIVTLKGIGKPYSLDPWTGEIKPILEYTVNGDGTLSIPVTILDTEAKLIAITDTNYIGNFGVQNVTNNSTDGKLIYNNGQVVFRATGNTTYDVTVYGFRKAGTIDSVAAPINLDTGWMLNVESWERGPLALLGTSDPLRNLKDVAKVAMGPYSNITLAEWASVSSELANISGYGEYTKTFDLTGDFTSAYLNLGNSYSNVVELKLNGHSLQIGDQFNRIYDLGSYVQQGKNTLCVKVSTIMDKAVRAAGRSFSYNFCSAYPSSYGLLGGVTVTPYVDVTIFDSNAVLASIRADEENVVVNNTAAYIVSLENAKGAGTVELSFTFDGYVLDKDSITATSLNGFALGIYPDLTFQYLGSGIWKGTVKYMYLADRFVNTNGLLDILKINGTALATGPATITLTGFSALGDNGTSVGLMPSQIKMTEATATIGSKPAVYSKYDLNKDGSIDETDLLYLVYFYQWNDRDAGWDTADLYGIFAKDCDFQVNGKVDLADMIELTANYGVYDPYAG